MIGDANLVDLAPGSTQSFWGGRRVSGDLGEVPDDRRFVVFGGNAILTDMDLRDRFSIGAGTGTIAIALLLIPR